MSCSRTITLVLLGYFSGFGCGDDGGSGPDPVADARLPGDAGNDLPDAATVDGMPLADASPGLPDAMMPGDAASDPDADPADAAPPDAMPNLAPTDIRLPNAVIQERSAAGIVVSTLQTVDPNPGDTHTYELLDDASGRFRLEGAKVVLADPSLINYETAAAHSISVRATDAGGLFLDETLTIQVGDQPEICSTADSGPGSLRQAVAAARAGEDIYLEGCGTITLASPIVVDKSLTIQGPGVSALVISGGHATRIFESTQSGNELVLEDLTLAQGSSNGAGGCIQSAGTLILRRMVVQGCTAGSQGGAVQQGSGLLIIGGSQFRDNTAADTGGAISTVGFAAIETSTFADNTSAAGGGALALFGSANIARSTFRGNVCTGNCPGGAILSMNATTISDTTLSGNRAGSGGGISTAGPTLALRHVTVAGNEVSNSGGGIQINGGTVELARTLVAGNTSASVGPDIGLSAGSLRSEGFNLVQSASGHGLIDGQNGDQIGAAPLLEPLASNGGTTETHALAAASPAIDAIPLASCTAGTDQRGLPRPAGAGCDIGSYERQ